MHQRLAVGLLVSAGILFAPTAFAVEYEIPIQIDNEDDLLELLTSRQISQETFDVLVEMLRRGVDLDSASREELYSLPNLTYADVDSILEYRKLAQRVGEPANLAAAGALTADKLRRIAPFLEVNKPDRTFAATNGRARSWIAAAPTDDRAPTGMLQLQAQSLRYFTVGASAVLARNRVSNVSWDGDSNGWLADPATARIFLPKYFFQYDHESHGVILGTYRIGFGQRLVFDNTDRYTPNGYFLDNAVVWNPGMSTRCRESQGELGASPCAGDLQYERVTSDIVWREGLRGAAAYAKIGNPKEAHLQTYAWVSEQSRDLYQYQIFNRAECADPRDNEDPNCGAPDVYKRLPDLTEPTSAFKNQTLPGGFTETLAGANIGYFFRRRAHVGITGYYADVAFNPRVEAGTAQSPAPDLDFQEWARYPYGGGFGAVGADAAWGIDWFDAFLEAAYSFDGMGQRTGYEDPVLGTGNYGGGGPAVIGRFTGTFDTQEVELAARYYDRKYSNPYAGPIAAADLYDGLRARDEAGARLRWAGLFWKQLSLRAIGDFWMQPSENQPKTDLYVRADYQLDKVWRPGLWAGFISKDLRSFEFGGEPVAGRDVCFEVTTEDGPTDAPISCTGEKVSVTPRIRVTPDRRLTATLQYTHEWQDRDGSTGIRQDMSLYALLNYRPIDSVRLRARVRYLDEDIDNLGKLETSLWTYLEAAYVTSFGLRTALRYDVIKYLDRRASTLGRNPEPEQFFRLEVAQKF